MSRPDVDDLERVVVAEGRQARRDLEQTVLSGVALTVPFFITILVLVWVFNMITDALAPLVNLLIGLGLVQGLGRLLVEGIAAGILFGIIFAVGLFAHHGPDTHLASRIDVLMEDIPGIGPIYSGVERMSDVLLEGDTQSFQEVKAVEFPTDGSFAIAFLTAHPTAAITDVVEGEDVVTVFVPMAPNPVMGGHLLHLPSDRVYDVDLSVEEGMEAIMTTGITIDETADGQS